MFKHSLQTVMSTPHDPAIDDTLNAVYDWMRNVWEHLVSHYLYAAGNYLI